MFWPAVLEKTQFLYFTQIWLLENQRSMYGTQTLYGCIDSFQSYWVFEKQFSSFGKNFNPKSSQKWPKSANLVKTLKPEQFGGNDSFLWNHLHELS